MKSRIHQRGQSMLELILVIATLGVLIPSLFLIGHLSYSMLTLGQLARHAAVCKAQGVAQPICQRELLSQARQYRVAGQIQKIQFSGDSLQSSVHLHWQTTLIGKKIIKGHLAHLRQSL